MSKICILKTKVDRSFKSFSFIIKSHRSRKLKTALISPDYSAETALAIATHQLLFAPPPSHHDYDDRSSKKPTTDYKYTGFTDKYTETPYDEFSSTPIYKTSTNRQYDTTYSTILNTPRAFSSTTFTAPKSSTYASLNDPTSSTYASLSGPKSSTYASINNPTTYGSTFADQKTSTFSSPFTAKVSRPAAFSAPEIITLSQGPSTLSSYLSSSTVSPRFSSSFPVPENVPATNRYLPNQKFIPVPVEDYAFSTGGYSDVREPAYFTREYLLESPVTKTYDGKLV